MRCLWTGGKALDHVWEILLDGSFIVGVRENGIVRGFVSLLSYKHPVYTPHELLSATNNVKKTYANALHG